MRILVTGATGWIGSAVVPELVAAGHHVIGLARNDASAAALEEASVEVHRGSLDDPASLTAGAAKAEGVVHLAYNHDFSQIPEAAKTDLAAIEALAEPLVGTGGPLMIASGAIGLQNGLETDRPDVSVFPRIASADYTLGLADRGIRSIVTRFAPTVHGAGDYGFVAELVRVAKRRGVSSYVGDGAHQWPAVHVSDAAVLVRKAVEDAAAGTVVHAIAEQGVATREIAEAIGRNLGLDVESVTAEQAPELMGWIGMFFSHGMAASNDLTRDTFDWSPAGPTLLEDLDAGHYNQA